LSVAPRLEFGDSLVGLRAQIGPGTFTGQLVDSPLVGDGRPNVPPHCHLPSDQPDDDRDDEQDRCHVSSNRELIRWRGAAAGFQAESADAG
jgi:hypothetical protein